MASNKGKGQEIPRFSFGIELEFLIAIREEEGPSHISNEFKDSQGAPMLIPRHELRAEWAMTKYCHEQVESDISQHFAACYLNAEVVAKGKGQASVFRSVPYSYLSKYQSWQAKTDGSIRLPNGEEPTLGEHFGYRWVGVKVNSPALWDVPGSFDEVRGVCELLRTKYWVLTPESCGLHIHLGQGPSAILANQLKKTATLLFAADPILAQMHPPSRRENDYCLSNRLYSAVAQGQTAAQSLKRGKFSPEGNLTKVILPTDLTKEMSASESNEEFSIIFPRQMLESYPVRPGEPLIYLERCEEAIIYDELNAP